MVWKGGRLLRLDGYINRYVPGHPHADSKGYLLEHIWVVEQLLGKRLPRTVEIHHVDDNKQNNAQSNLVVCENMSYHKLLHRRSNALRECGNANWRQCAFCKQYDDLINMVRRSPTGGICHRACQLEHRRRGDAATRPNYRPRPARRRP